MLYLLSLRAGCGRSERMKPFSDVFVAHRGLYDNIGIPENSLAAFEKAVNCGYGIELDVQMTKDGRLVVFHDVKLKRMCGIKKALISCSFNELQKLTLGNTGEKIPLFEDVLEFVAGKVPLVVEIKPEGNWKETAARTAVMLDKYEGEFCVESFHPLVLAWFRKNRPDVIRGQLSTDYFRSSIKVNAVYAFLLSNLMLNFLSRPDFIAFNHRYKNMLSYRLCRKLYSPVNAAWTIKSQAQLEAAKDVFQIMIFDGFSPK